jgi:hypothetical protein
MENLAEKWVVVNTLLCSFRKVKTSIICDKNNRNIIKMIANLVGEQHLSWFQQTAKNSFFFFKNFIRTESICFSSDFYLKTNVSFLNKIWNYLQKIHNVWRKLHRSTFQINIRIHREIFGSKVNIPISRRQKFLQSFHFGGLYQRTMRPQWNLWNLFWTFDHCEKWSKLWENIYLRPRNELF